jgi:hypothetical protein
MNPLVMTLLAIALMLGGVVALLLSGEPMSGTLMGVRMMSSGARFDEFGGYVVLILLIAALGSVVAWMLFGKTE